MLNLKNTLDGYLKNVEVIGNTIQDENNLANIRSVGDKVEGQELYKIDVVSCGKNIFNAKIYENHTYTYINNVVNFGKTLQAYQPIRLIFKVKPNTEYVFRSTTSHNLTRQVSSHNLPTDTPVNVVATTNGTGLVRFNSLNNDELIVSLYSSTLIESGSDIIVSNLQIEEGIQATEYEPYQENKLEILSPVQLEKVGDVADRIICKDGVWGVEKHVLTKLFDGSENNVTNATLDGNQLNYRMCYSKRKVLGTIADSSKLLSNKFECFVYSSSTNNVTVPSFRFIHTNTELYCTVPATEFTEQPSVQAFKEKVASYGTYIKYVTTQPQFIPLPHDQQVKLRTFAGQTNVIFNTEIAGQIKAQVPKSLGAVVNTHTEQIEMLHNALKSVLAGDMYSLATLLYPEDFEQNDNTEQDIMVIPE